ncbi:hypothetical protein [Pararhizobium sp. PWRC1-1]|uniref:hypothetical protein n=1 Tax=Pararhizobium sp. PWRC1-1 TaxID=2804566 RepID=UPI003CF4DC9A
MKILKPWRSGAAAFSFVAGAACTNNGLVLSANPMILPVFCAVYLFLPIEKFRVNFDLRHVRMRASQTSPQREWWFRRHAPAEELAGGPNKINSNNRAAQ